MTAWELFGHFRKLAPEEQWKFWARVQLWEQEKRDGLYNVAKQVTHEAGLPWTDPRTGKTHPPPRSYDFSRGVRAKYAGKVRSDKRKRITPSATPAARAHRPTPG